MGAGFQVVSLTIEVSWHLCFYDCWRLQLSSRSWVTDLSSCKCGLNQTSGILLGWKAFSTGGNVMRWDTVCFGVRLWEQNLGKETVPLTAGHSPILTRARPMKSAEIRDSFCCGHVMNWNTVYRGEGLWEDNLEIETGQLVGNSLTNFSDWSLISFFFNQPLCILWKHTTFFLVC